jgi:hypothetical protein
MVSSVGRRRKSPAADDEGGVAVTVAANRQPPSVWTAGAVALGVVALVGAAVPFYADVPVVVAVEATVVGGVGSAAAIAGLAHLRRVGAMVSVSAVFGTVACGLAVVLGVTAVVLGVVAVRDQQRRPTLDTATVLGRELSLTMGAFSYTGRGSHLETQLPVTVRNKLTKTRWFHIVVAAFDRDRHQVMSATSSEILTADASETLELFDYVSDPKVADRLANSTFRIIDVTSEPVT